MRTTTIEGIPPASNDVAILGLVQASASDGGGNIMRIGIRNDSGDIYRTIETCGLQEFMTMITGLQTLGLTDSLANHPGTVGGFDAIFSN